MSGDVTIQALERLTRMPDSDNPAELIAAQRYNDVLFEGGSITGVDITPLTPWTIDQGGTGETTANDALNALLPDQTGQSGKALKTDGTNASWESGGAGTVTEVSVTTANGVSGSVATATTTPAITLTLGAITPSSITLPSGGSLRTSTSDTNNILLQAYDVNGAAYTTFIKLTAGNDPFCEITGPTLIDGATIGSGTPGDAVFTTLTSSGAVNLIATGSDYVVLQSDASVRIIGNTTGTAEVLTDAGDIVISSSSGQVYITGGAATPVQVDCDLNVTEDVKFDGAVTLALAVKTTAGDYTVGAHDYNIIINKASGAATGVALPATPATGRTLVIKDGKGDAATNNITITPNSGNIDGSSNYVINANYGSVTIVYNGTQWNVV